MSISNIVSSFSSTAFFKAGGELSLPLMAMAVGVGIGMTTCLIDRVRKINKENPSIIKSDIDDLVRLARNIWCATVGLVIMGVSYPNRGFLIVTTASFGLMFAVIPIIKYNIQHPDLIQGNTQEKLAKAVDRIFLVLFPTAAVTSMLLVSACVQAFAQKN